MLEYAFKPVTLNSIKNQLTKSYVSVISFLMFYDNMKTMVYKVIGAVIYTIIDNYICLDYLGILQDQLSKHENKF